MRIINLDDWPWGGRMLVVLAQHRANTLGHAVTSGAHIAWCLLSMQPVRAILGDEERVKKIDRQIEIALMTLPKSGGKAAEFSKVVLGLLEGGGERTTLNVLRTSMIGMPGMGDAQLQIAAHAEKIAALLDEPKLEQVMKEPAASTTARELPFLTLGFVLAVKLGHRDFTTRHILAAGARSIDDILVKHEETSIASTVAELEALADGPKREGKVIQMTPRVIGAVASALATPEPGRALLEECFRGDPAVAFSDSILTDARARARSRLSSKSAAPETT